jgi:hypothetical protein
MESLGKQIDHLLHNSFTQLVLATSESPSIRKLRILYTLVTLSAQQSSEYFNRDN